LITKRSRINHKAIAYRLIGDCSAFAQQLRIAFAAIAFAAIAFAAIAIAAIVH
jgi:hypothetical protein